ncbi:MAG TPA: IS4 family transposase [Gemmataceae bacterium]|nr:IS4 family transposase [Gemmataceae bacterium]
MKPNARYEELDDWELVCQHLPSGWKEQAHALGALRRTRGFPDASVLLRTLLVHLAGCCSLKEALTNAKVAGWCDVSAVALFKRLCAAEHWLRWMADQLWQRHPTPSLPNGYRVRAIDATTVSVPGSIGTDWRLHFGINLETLQCDFFEVTDAHGGETFRRIPVAQGDLLLGDRVYATPPGIAHAVQRGGHVLTRVNHKALPLFDFSGKPFRLAERLRSLKVGQCRKWSALIWHGSCAYPGRLVAVKRSRWSACLERRSLRKRAAKKQKRLSKTAVSLAGYFYVWTDVPAAVLDAMAVLDWYRCRWQIELCFKRMKSILKLGELPKRRQDSCRAWLHGKLLVSLLLERLLDAAEHFSPWGYALDAATESMA